MSLGLTAKIEGVEQLQRKLSTLSRKTAGKIWRKGLGQATTPILKSARARAPRRTGQLKRSLGKKVKVKRDGSGGYGIVGPRRGFAEEVDGVRQDPARYAHLAERHTPYLGPALRSEQGNAMAILRKVAAEEILKDVR